MQDLGFDIVDGQSAFIVMLYDAKLSQQMADMLLRYLRNWVLFPVVLRIKQE
jgi:hypothetical protein